MTAAITKTTSEARQERILRLDALYLAANVKYPSAGELTMGANIAYHCALCSNNTPRNIVLPL